MAEKNTDQSDGKKAKDNADELKKQLAQLNREWETLQNAIPATQAGEAILKYIAGKKDPLTVEGHTPDWDPVGGGPCC